MAKKSWIYKQKRSPKFCTRAYTRCGRCGRARAVFRDYMLCRLCFRHLASWGYIPGVKKASW